MDGARAPRRFGVPQGLLGTEPDPILEALAEEAASAVGVGMAAVSLMLNRLQLFAGAYGLPPELDRTRAIDRDAGICQFVVRDNVLIEVTDARRDLRVPQLVTRNLRLGAFLAAPIRVHGEPIGSVCVWDQEPRRFTAEDHAVVTQCAERAAARIMQLSRAHGATETLVNLGTVGIRSELRNLLVPLRINIRSARAAKAELELAARLNHGATSPSACECLKHGLLAADDLSQILDEMEQASARIEAQALALDFSLSRNRPHPPTVDQILEAATTLAHHHLKISGGVKWSNDAIGQSVAARSSEVILAVAAMLTLTAQLTLDLPGQSGLWGSVKPVGAGLEWAVGSHALSHRDARSCVASLVPVITADLAGASLRSRDNELVLSLAAA